MSSISQSRGRMMCLGWGLGDGEAGGPPPSFPQCFGTSLRPLSVYPSSLSAFCPRGYYREFRPTSI